MKTVAGEVLVGHGAKDLKSSAYPGTAWIIQGDAERVMRDADGALHGAVDRAPWGARVKPDVAQDVGDEDGEGELVVQEAVVPFSAGAERRSEQMEVAGEVVSVEGCRAQANSRGLPDLGRKRAPAPREQEHDEKWCSKNVGGPLGQERQAQTRSGSEHGHQAT